MTMLERNGWILNECLSMFLPSRTPEKALTHTPKIVFQCPYCTAKLQTHDLPLLFSYFLWKSLTTSLLPWLFACLPDLLPYTGCNCPNPQLPCLPWHSVAEVPLCLSLLFFSSLVYHCPLFFSAVVRHPNFRPWPSALLPFKLLPACH